MNNCFTETTRICLTFGKYDFNMLDCLTDSVSEIQLGMKTFPFQGLTHLQKRIYCSVRMRKRNVLQHFVVVKSDPTFLPLGPSATSWEGSSFSRFLMLGSAPLLISSFTTSAWFLWFCRAHATCRAVFPLNVWNKRAESVRPVCAACWFHRDRTTYRGIDRRVWRWMVA